MSSANMNSKTLPIEILCEIFLLLCEKPIALHVLNNRSSSDEFPWAVGRVCKHWREAFLSYPRLWTSLFLQYTYERTYVDGNLSYPDLQKFVEIDRRTTMYLERSRQLPLTIAVSIKSSSSRRFSHFPQNAWKSLLSCSSRWERAHLAIGFVPNMVNDLLECQGKMSTLESLDLNISGLIHECNAQHSVFTVVPRLTNLQLKHPGGNSRWIFPWSQLTRLRIEVSRSDLGSHAKMEVVLSELQNLEELQFFPMEDTDHTFFSPSAPIRLPKVRILEVPLVRYSRLLEWFETPLLEHLWVHDFSRNDCQWEDDRWNRIISSFIQRSSCLIRSLTLQGFHYKPGHILIGALASIERLCIRDPHRWIATDLIQCMTNSEGRIYLPSLQALQVICCSTEVDSDDFMAAISHLLEARGRGTRSSPVVSLEEVILQLKWGKNCNCCRKRCRYTDDEGMNGILDEILTTMLHWRFVAGASVDRTQSQIRVKPL